MRIVFVAAKFQPFSGASEEARGVAAVAARMVDKDQRVEAIVSMNSDVDPEEFSLARRLRKVEVNVNETNLVFERFDGRTASNIDVHLLRSAGAELDDGLPFSKAACTFMEPSDDEDCVCFWWNTVPPSFDKGDPVGSDWRHIVVVTTQDGPWDQAFSADKTVVIGRKLADRISIEGSTYLADLVKDGTLSVVPRAVESSREFGPGSKESAKASLQASVGLPIRGDVPLILFARPKDREFLGILKGVLTGDVQVVLPLEEVTEEIEGLTDRYPDRLVIASAELSEELLLSGSDLCLVASGDDQVLRALAAGSVPVIQAALAEGIVDLEPSLGSGSGFVFDQDNETAMAEALERGVAAFHKGKDFRDLSVRISGFVIDRARQAEMLLQIAGVAG